MQQVTNYWDAKVKVMPITIKLEIGVGSYDLPDKNILNNCSEWVGIAHREPAGSRKTRTGAALINQNCFRAAHLRLRSEVDDDFLREIPLEIIQQRTSGDNFMYRLPGIPMDIANSKISISDTSTIVAGEEIELLIFYIPK
jgi:hypothetical protein